MALRRHRGAAGAGRTCGRAAHVEERFPEGPERPDLRAVHRHRSKPASSPPRRSSPTCAWRPKGTTAPPPEKPAATDKKDAKKDVKKEEMIYPFEDVYFTDLRGGAGQPLKLTRAFAVPPGEYDVYVGLRERGASGASRAHGQGRGPQAGAVGSELPRRRAANELGHRRRQDRAADRAAAPAMRRRSGRTCSATPRSCPAADLKFRRPKRSTWSSRSTAQRSATTRSRI